MVDIKKLEKKLMKKAFPKAKRTGRAYCDWCKKDRNVIETYDYKLICKHCGKVIPRLKEVEII